MSDLEISKKLGFSSSELSLVLEASVFNRQSFKQYLRSAAIAYVFHLQSNKDTDDFVNQFCKVL